MTQAPRRAAAAAARWVRLVLVVLGAVVIVSVAIRPASAHNTLVSTDPTDGQRLSQTPAAVTLTFDEPAIALGSQVVITGPGGPVQQGPPRSVDNTVTQSLQPNAPGGSYTVAWRITSADGHPISGSFTFTTAEPGGGRADSADPSPGSAPAANPATPSTTGWLVAGAGGLVLVGLVLAVVRRRRLEQPGDAGHP